MADCKQILIKKLASKYLWWKQPEDALKHPERIVIQVMDIGDFNDVTAMLEIVG